MRWGEEKGEDEESQRGLEGATERLSGMEKERTVLVV